MFLCTSIRFKEATAGASLPRSIVSERGGDDYVVPFFEKRIEGLNVTYVDMHGIYCMCREVMDTFDWEHFDLIFPRRLVMEGFQ